MPLVIRGMPLQSEIADRRLATPQRSVLLFILKSDLPGCPPPEPLLMRFGLTEGQAGYALAVGAGYSLKDAAALLGVKKDTARTMPKHVHQRFGIHRQSELARTVAKVAPFQT